MTDDPLNTPHSARPFEKLSLYLQYCFNLFAERERFSNGLVECCVFSGSLVICFYSYSRKFLFLLSKNIIFLFLFLLSKLEIRISNFSFYSRNSRSEFQISLSTLEFTFLTLVNACTAVSISL